MREESIPVFGAFDEDVVAAQADNSSARLSWGKKGERLARACKMVCDSLKGA